jgi:hypothetical protein
MLGGLLNELELAMNLKYGKRLGLYGTRKGKFGSQAANSHAPAASSAIPTRSSLEHVNGKRAFSMVKEGKSNYCRARIS